MCHESLFKAGGIKERIEACFLSVPGVRAWITSVVFTPSHVHIKQTSQMALNTDEQAPNKCEK